MTVREEHPCPSCGALVQNVVRAGKPRTYCGKPCRERHKQREWRESKRYQREIVEREYLLWQARL